MSEKINSNEVFCSCSKKLEEQFIKELDELVSKTFNGGLEWLEIVSHLIYQAKDCSAENSDNPYSSLGYMNDILNENYLELYEACHEGE